MYPDGIPDPEKVGFIPLNAIGHGGDFQTAIQTVGQLLQRPSFLVDDEGYEDEIIAASIDESHQRYAWVECKSQEFGWYVSVEFRLYVKVGDKLIISWEIETYNPYFGCQIELLQWMENHLMLIYHEKHHTFICSFDLELPKKESKPTPSLETGHSPLDLFVRAFLEKPRNDEPIARYKIADEWCIYDQAVIYGSEVVDKVERRSFPKLRLLKPWTAEYTRSINALPPCYDEMNELRRKWSKKE